ncbi:MAG: V4R domain-containing protein [Nitrososphaerales archaeon]
MELEIDLSKKNETDNPLKDIIYRQLLAGVRVHGEEEGHVTNLYRTLGKSLIAVFGGPIASVVFHSLGQFEGERLSKNLSISSIISENWVEMATTFLEMEGLVKFDVIEISPKKTSGRFLVVNMVDNAEKAYISGEGGGVGCYFTRGFLQKILETFTGKNIQITESKCRLNGNGNCEYIFTLGKSKG